MTMLLLITYDGLRMFTTMCPILNKWLSVGVLYLLKYISLESLREKIGVSFLLS